MINLYETFSCPVCGNAKTRIHSTELLLSDVRYDVAHCDNCDTLFGVYSKTSEATVKILKTSAGKESQVSEEPNNE